MANVDIPMPKQVRERLKALGIKEDDIDNQVAIYVSLYQQALKGNVNACSQYLKLFENEEEIPEEKKDITEAVKEEEKRTLLVASDYLKSCNSIVDYNLYQKAI